MSCYLILIKICQHILLLYYFVMKRPIDIDRLAAKAGALSANTEITERRAIIDKLNETRKQRLESIKHQLQERQLQPCMNQNQIYIEGHSIEKPKHRSNPKSRIKVADSSIPSRPYDKNQGIGEIEKLTFDKRFKNYLNHKQEFLEKAKRRQQAIRQKRRKIKQGENNVDDYFNEEEILSQTGSDYQYKDADDMGAAYETLATGKRKKKSGVQQLFYAEKFQFAFRLLQFESLMQLMPDPSQALISKDLLLNYLFEQPMIMMLYSVNPFLIADQIAEYETQISSMLSFEEFSCFLLIDREPTYTLYTEQNLAQARRIGRGLKCAPIVGKWIDQTGIYEDLLDIFDSVDMFGNQKAQRDVLAKKLTMECEKKRIMDDQVVEIVNVNKLVTIRRLIYEIEHEVGGNEMIERQKFENFLRNYHRLLTPPKDKLITKLIMAGKYDTSYIYIVSGEVLQFLKEVFNEMQKFAEYFVKKQKFIEKVIKNKKYEKLKGLFVRSEGNRYVVKQTVEQTLQRFFYQADFYVDIEDILDFFSNRGRPKVVQYHVYIANLERQLQIIEREELERQQRMKETGEEPSTSSDEQFEKQLKIRKFARKQQKLIDLRNCFKYDYQKKFNVTIPITFQFQKRDKEKKVTIRQKKLKQMLQQKQRQQQQSLKPIPRKQVPKHVKEPLYEKMLKDQERERKQRLERFKLEIQNSMVPMPSRLTEKHVPQIHCDFAREPYDFVARPMPWYCQVNLLDRINKQKQQRRERILEQIINRHHDNDLPEGVIRMLERHEEIQKKRQQKNKTNSTTSVGQCTFIPEISHRIPDFKAIHERLEVDLEIAKQNKQMVHPQPFSFETRDKKAKSHHSHVNCVPNFSYKMSQSKAQYKPDQNQVQIKPTLKFIGLVEKRRSEQEAKLKKQQQIQQNNEVRKMRHQKFAPLVQRVLKQNQNQLGKSRQEVLNKIKNFQRQQKKKVKEYQNKMIDIYTKVMNRPLLIESNQYGEADIKKNSRLQNPLQGESYHNQKQDLKQTAAQHPPQKDSRRRQIQQNYEQKRRKAIEQPPGQYLIEQDSDELKGLHHQPRHAIGHHSDDGIDYEDEDGEYDGDFASDGQDDNQ